MPSNPLTPQEIYELASQSKLPPQRFFATNPDASGTTGWYDILTYLDAIGVGGGGSLTNSNVLIDLGKVLFNPK